jgi:hypothetical protein
MKKKNCFGVLIRPYWVARINWPVANPELMEPAVLCGKFAGVHLCLPGEYDMHGILILSGGGMPGVLYGILDRM